jgi:hypothetical protein
LKCLSATADKFVYKVVDEALHKFLVRGEEQFLGNDFEEEGVKDGCRLGRGRHFYSVLPATE